MKKAEHYAKLLRQARKSGKFIDPLRDEIKDGGIEFAYQIQEINTSKREENGSRLVGRKIGLTSTVVQKQLGVSQPDFGALFHDTEVLNGQEISIHQLHQPKVEAEIAVILGEDLDYEEMTMIDIMNAIDYCLPAIEIVGSRIKDWDIKIYDTIADNASASHYVLGHSPKTLDEFDIVDCQMKMMKNKKIVSEGSGAECLGSPLNALFWLANTMLNLDEPLQEGDLIMTGALGKMATVEAGDQIVAEFSGLGKVSVGFSDFKI